MFGFKKELGLMSAAALAACSPQEQAPMQEPTTESSTSIEEMQASVAQEIAAEPTADTPEGRALARKEAIESGQYTAEQLDIMASGMTQEVDGMTQEEIDRLGQGE